MYKRQITNNKKVEVSSIEDIGKDWRRFIKGKKVFSISDTDVYGKVLPFAIMLVPMFLILGQDDTGSALVFSSFFFVFYREGVIGRVFIVGLLAIVLAIVTLMYDKHVAFSALGVLTILLYSSFIKRTNMALANVGFVLVFLVLMGIFDLSTSFNTYVLCGWISINLMVVIIVSELWKRKERAVDIGGRLIIKKKKRRGWGQSRNVVTMTEGSTFHRS